MLRRRLIGLTVVSSLYLILTAATSARDAKPHDAILPVPRGANWMKRHESFNARVKQGNVDLLMIGDSITHGWEHRGKKADLLHLTEGGYTIWAEAIEPTVTKLMGEKK